MDRLNTLEKSLPPEGPVNDQNIDRLNQQVTQEFKLAANAVSSLYRLSSERSSLSRHQGYVDCLEDVLELLGEGCSARELMTWCQERKLEKSGNTSSTTKSSPTFRLSRPAMSVERAPKRVLQPQLTEKFVQQRGDETKEHKRRTKKPRS
ncbi:LADA_0B02674g1_1 [Lachancea dasiensis]|uniref:LADA_0B02674g1_1 n=1 Tax=Lachancea dasiensis TaxID=1072105 RepID=A0A1G4ISS8_9SACH|nr:LADA_0B02674g1_1 [Lachancea dasiensis]